MLQVYLNFLAEKSERLKRLTIIYKFFGPDINQDAPIMPEYK